MRGGSVGRDGMGWGGGQGGRGGGSCVWRGVVGCIHSKPDTDIPRPYILSPLQARHTGAHHPLLDAVTSQAGRDRQADRERMEPFFVRGSTKCCVSLMVLGDN